MSQKQIKTRFQIQEARRAIFARELPLAIRRTAWMLYQHELQRINPETGKPYTPTKALSHIMAWMDGQKVISHRKLTPKESRVLRLMVENGMTQKQIALEVGCELDSIKRRFAYIRKKVNVITTYQLVAVAVERGWVNAPEV